MCRGRGSGRGRGRCGGGGRYDVVEMRFRGWQSQLPCESARSKTEGRSRTLHRLQYTTPQAEAAEARQKPSQRTVHTADITHPTVRQFHGPVADGSRRQRAVACRESPSTVRVACNFSPNPHFVPRTEHQAPPASEPRSPVACPFASASAFISVQCHPGVLGHASVNASAPPLGMCWYFSSPRHDHAQFIFTFYNSFANVKTTLLMHAMCNHRHSHAALAGSAPYEQPQVLTTLTRLCNARST